MIYSSFVVLFFIFYFFLFLALREYLDPSHEARPNHLWDPDYQFRKFNKERQVSYPDNRKLDLSLHKLFFMCFWIFLTVISQDRLVFIKIHIEIFIIFIKQKEMKCS